MAEFLIIQECVVIAFAALLGLLWWSTRQGGKVVSAENERRAELLCRMTMAYDGARAELLQWRRLRLHIDYCAVSAPTPADYAAVNGSGAPVLGRQAGPWHRAVDEPVKVALDAMDQARILTGTQHAGPFRIDHRRQDLSGYARAHVSTRFDTSFGQPNRDERPVRVLVELCGVPRRSKLPDFASEIGELQALGWYHVPPQARSNKAAVAVAAAQLDMTEGTDSDH